MRMPSDNEVGAHIGDPLCQVPLFLCLTMAVFLPPVKADNDSIRLFAGKPDLFSDHPLFFQVDHMAYCISRSRNIICPVGICKKSKLSALE